METVRDSIMPASMADRTHAHAADRADEKVPLDQVVDSFPGGQRHGAPEDGDVVGRG